MYVVSEVIRTKGAGVYAAPPEATVLDAARAMNEHKIGCLIVVDGERLVGIITERDIMTRVVAAERMPACTHISEIMTRNVLTCEPGANLDDLRTLMRERRVRHIPVVDCGRLIGMVSIGDLNAAEAKTLTETIGYLEAYITH
jgi:CBS domain-containing protein